MEEQKYQEAEYAFPYHYITRFNDGYAQSVTDAWGMSYASTIQYVLERLRALPFNRILDVGCGDGRLSREIALAFPARTVIGIDCSKRAIALARAMNGDLARLRFEALDIATAPADGEHDAAVLMEVLEHIPPDQCAAFVAGLRRRMRPDAPLLVTVPHRNKPVEYKHFRHFDIASATAELAPHFTVEEAVPFERRGWHRKLVLGLASNRWFSLAHRNANAWLYRHYQRHLFACRDETEAQRIFLLARAR